MSLLSALEARCESKCELCNGTTNLTGYTIPPRTSDNAEDQIAVCPKCLEQIENPNDLDSNHLRCLSESMWSPVPAVQVVTHRLLGRLAKEPWAGDLQSQMYMEEETAEWAAYSENKVIHKDSNGQVLQAGDNVVLIQDLNVKGANFTAKRGTAVKRIRLVPDNEEHIEGRIEGQQIVILTKYVKKS